MLFCGRVAIGVAYMVFRGVVLTGPASSSRGEATGSATAALGGEGVQGEVGGMRGAGKVVGRGIDIRRGQLVL